MKNLNTSYLLLFFILILYPVKNYGQKTETDNFLLNTYGIFRAHLAVFKGQAEIQDASPRVGFVLNYKFGTNNKYRIFAGGEFAVNLIDNQFNFQADPNVNDSGFSTFKFLDKKSTFSTRLGFVGIDLAQYGNITLGKQNSLYKEIAGQTDIFNVMSGQAAYVYAPTGSDGGETGTGRVESAATYKNHFGKLDYGFQAQFRANSDTFFDSFGTYLNYRITESLSIGAAYNKDFLGPTFKDIINFQGLEGDPEYYTFNIIYKNKRLFIGGVYAQQKIGDFVNTIDEDEEDITIFYNGKGYELTGSYLFMNDRLKLMAGFNYKAPETDNEYLVKDFKKRLYLIGLQYQFVKFASFYSEYKYEESITARGFKSPNVFMIGLRVDFDKTWHRQIEM